MSITKVTDNLYLAYVEAKLDIDGSVRPHDLLCQFKIDRSKASKIIKRYSEDKLTSCNIEYHEKGRHSTYVRTDDFKLQHFSKLSSKQFMSSVIEVYGTHGCSTKDVYFKYIDAYVEVYNLIGPINIENQFGMHRSIAGSVLKKYREDRLSCSNLRYHLQGNKSCYIRTTIFKRGFLPIGKSPLQFILALDDLFGSEKKLPSY